MRIVCNLYNTHTKTIKIRNAINKIKRVEIHIIYLFFTLFNKRIVVFHINYYTYTMITMIWL